jgi:predicted enzyme related to lactoylglutathione lyase
MPVTGIVPAVDTDRAWHYYEDTLGLNLDWIAKEAGIFQVHAGGGSSFVVYTRSTPTMADHTAIGFNVTDIESVVSDLRARGVMFEEYDMPGMKTVNGIADQGGAKSAFFKDSEGNILSLNQM